MFFGKRKREGNGPTEAVAVGEAVEAQLWIKTREDGSRRIDFSLGRINPTGRSYRTFRLRDLLEFPRALSTLGSALAKAPDQPRELREQLAHLSGLLEQVAEAVQLVPVKAINGRDNEEAGVPRLFG